MGDCLGFDRQYMSVAVLGLLTVIFFLLILPLRSRSRRALPWAIAAALLVVGSFVTFVNAFGWSMRLGAAWFPWIEKAGLVQCVLSLYFTRIAYRCGGAPVPAPQVDGSSPAMTGDGS